MIEWGGFDKMTKTLNRSQRIGRNMYRVGIAGLVLTTVGMFTGISTSTPSTKPEKVVRYEMISDSINRLKSEKGMGIKLPHSTDDVNQLLNEVRYSAEDIKRIDSAITLLGSEREKLQEGYDLFISESESRKNKASGYFLTMIGIAGLSAPLAAIGNKKRYATSTETPAEAIGVSRE